MERIAGVNKSFAVVCGRNIFQRDDGTVQGPIIDLQQAAIQIGRAGPGIFMIVDHKGKERERDPKTQSTLRSKQVVVGAAMTMAPMVSWGHRRRHTAPQTAPRCFEEAKVIAPSRFGSLCRWPLDIPLCVTYSSRLVLAVLLLFSLDRS